MSYILCITNKLNHASVSDCTLDIPVSVLRAFVYILLNPPPLVSHLLLQ